MNSLLDFSFNDENFVLRAILLAIEKSIDTLTNIDCDLFKVSNFTPNAIGTAKADLMDALQSLYTARSWAKDAADLQDTSLDKLPGLDPMDIAIQLIGFVSSIIMQYMNIPFADPEDPAMEAFCKSEKNALLADASTFLNDAAKCIEQAADVHEEKEAVNA